MEEGDAFSNHALYAAQADGSAVCLLRGKEKAGVKSLSDWEQCLALITPSSFDTSPPLP